MAQGSGLFSKQRAARPHLVRGSGGLKGEIADLRSDIDDELAPMAAIAVEEFIDPIAADPDGLVLSQASVAAPVTLSGAGLDGALGGGPFDPPRNITVATAGATPANAPATMDVVGTDINDDALLETVAVAQTAATAVGTKAFKTVTSVDFPAADGTAALLEVGIGDAIGLAKPIKSRAGAAAGLSAIEAGTITSPAAGAFADAVVGAPHGTYTPAAAPDATNDYAIYYEWDATA